MTISHQLHGVEAPSSIPPSVGAHYTNTATGDQYLSKGTSAVSDWVKQAKAIVPVVMTGLSEVTLDLQSGSHWHFTLTQDMTVTLPESAEIGDQFVLTVVQGGLGGKLVILPTSVSLERSGETDVDTGAGEVSEILLRYAGNEVWVGRIATFGGKYWNESVIALAWYFNPYTYSAIFDLQLNRLTPLLCKISGSYGYAEDYCEITASGRFVITHTGNDLPLTVIDTARFGNEFREGCVTTDIALARGGFVWGENSRPPVIFGNSLYVIDAAQIVCKVLLNQAVRVDLFTAEGTPQSVAGNGAEVTLTYIGVGGGMPNPVAGLLTYDEATGTLLPTQYPAIEHFVPSTGSSSPPSPMFCSVAYSPDGSQMALLVSMFYLNDEMNTVMEVFLVLYEVSTKTVLFQSADLSGQISFDSSATQNIQYSKNGRFIYCSTVTPSQVGVLLVFDTQTQTAHFLSLEDVTGAPIPSGDSDRFASDNKTCVAGDGTVIHVQSGVGLYRYKFLTNTRQYMPFSDIDVGLWDGATESTIIARHYFAVAAV